MLRMVIPYKVGEEKTMFCTNCGESMSDNQDVCVKCGVKKGTASKFCANCGEALADGAAVCTKCGVAVKSGGGDLAGKDKTMIIVICLLLGGIGVHNFMMGETKKGVFKIVLCLCFGLSYIFAIIDLIKIVTDKYEVNPDKLI